MGSLATPLSFLVNTLFSLYTLAVILRFLLQRQGADYYNPLSQLVIRATDPVLRPLYRLIPVWRRFDLAAIVLMLILQTINVTLLALIQPVAFPGPLALPLLAVVKLVILFITLFIFTILVQVVVSWLSPGNPNPVLGALWSLNRPILQPLRRMMPNLGGIDISPMLAMIGLFFLYLLVQQLFLPAWLVRM
ncbi:YggT family protein [Gammaproteobacteria bacterium AB-CW1]|uniref:YggT family protein n=1 Tax=Natronospira elongata TaxID=3110268 RepID=A0AAP6MKK3_9GAMM|nr:YggT family protein [Gammaproteobacteria bacterium AB-CW1]